jgi:DNA repair photolyase
MRPIPVDNPPNPWESSTIDYLGEPPETGLVVYEDHSRSILAENDSPDVGFRFSVNPYRGCFHACAYCLSGDTRVLLADLSTKALADVRVGDEVMGTVKEGRYRRFQRSRVLAHWGTVKPAWRVALDDGVEIIASSDHRFLTQRGWKHVARDVGERPHLTAGNHLFGVGPFVSAPREDLDYRTGYVSGMIRGDGLLGSYAYTREGRSHGDQHQFRLALIDFDALRRTQTYLVGLGVDTREFSFAAAASGRQPMRAIRTHARSKVERVRDLVSWPEDPSVSWCKGFLAGIFDAEGSHASHSIRICNQDLAIIDQTTAALARLGFSFVVEHRPTEKPLHVVRIVGGFREHVRFFQTVRPAIARKTSLHGIHLKGCARPRVISVRPLGFDLPMFDITTETGDFIANGVVAHNCYARPSHEQLGFGAGTDFERKIVVKPRAAELLREAFEKPSWKGELVCFSGNTDCYQPLEASYRITRACLEVCAEYRNPVSIITKSPLIERDLDVLVELHRSARIGVNVSIPFWKTENARAIEPFVTTPVRRMRTVERLAKAGLRVNVMVAPIIPGLNDEDIPHVLRAAKDAGAVSAARVVLRLPGSVKDVFVTRLREALPLRAEKVLARTREMRGGKLYDTRWGKRQTGEGEYADAIAGLFDRTVERLGLVHRECSDDLPTTFRRPTDRGGQMRLFG